MVVTELKEVGKLTFGGLAVVTALIASGGFVIETIKTLKPMTPPGFMVQVAGSDGELIDVHVQRRGDGDVTVLLDGGVGETSFDWDNVAADVAEFATVVSVDRPGLGFSKPGAKSRTSTQIVSEYKQILEKLNVTGDVVLVAHGAGGYNMRQLAEELKMTPGSSPTCGGLVLVDTLQETLRGKLESVSPVVHKSLSEMDGNGELVLRLARLGLIRLINVVQYSKLSTKYSAAALPYVQYFLPSPAHREGVLREAQAIPETEQRFRDSASVATPFEFPCVVLSHGKAGMFGSMKMQKGLVSGWCISWFTMPAHCIHHEKPEVVAKAVRALVDEIHGDVEKHRGLMSLTTDA
ncbi:unnamed protein product [Peronospora destructor]|uniref:AB hydrolase-1 domain-containing protein n=1 Tax=Peronospora destructor TaxID=86335 RepID=A0AAV0VHJ2_9STRA|nr:unnamed protein product [Peronospora destructor]